MSDISIEEGLGLRILSIIVRINAYNTGAPTST